ncbi:MAG: hypothetical protein ACFFDO_01745 [Candidatus Thorarchaeota archaeon]
MSFDELVSLREKIKSEIKAKQEELQNIEKYFKQKKIEIEKKINNEFKLLFKKLEVKRSKAHKELTDINAKLKKFVTRTDHIDLGDLKRRKSELNITIKNITKEIKGIEKKHAKVLKDELNEFLKEKKAKITQLNHDIKKLSQKLENKDIL